MAEDESVAEYLFGSVPAPFFELLGQTMAAAGLVKSKLYDLVTSLDQAEQHMHAGGLAGKMVKRCRVLLRGDHFRQDLGVKVEIALKDSRRDDGAAQRSGTQRVDVHP